MYIAHRDICIGLKITYKHAGVILFFVYNALVCEEKEKIYRVRNRLCTIVESMYCPFRVDGHNKFPGFMYQTYAGIGL